MLIFLNLMKSEMKILFLIRKISISEAKQKFGEKDWFRAELLVFLKIGQKSRKNLFQWKITEIGKFSI